MNKEVLSINNLQTYFFTKKGKVPAVDGVSLNIKEGQIIGIVGESGCGKSMTALSIMGLIKKPGKIVNGSIIFQDKDLLKLKDKELENIRGKDISMIFQEPMTSLNPLLTIGYQLSEILRLHKKMSKVKAKEESIKMLEKVGISEAQKRYFAYPHELSGGLRQRVMIAMAMLCKPKILIADEPTTALDVSIELQILTLMKNLCKESKTSIILISHNMNVVSRLCDYTYVMYAGKVIEEAYTKDLFENPRHPYTRGLLKSMPDMQKDEKRLYNIKGIVPSLLDLKEGCSFYERCECAVLECADDMPKLKEYNIGHKVACFIHE